MYSYILQWAIVLVLSMPLGSTLNADAEVIDYIVGGVDVAVGERPYQVSLQYNKQHICGGSIIGSCWILTAAHCVVGFRRSSLSILAGTNKLNSGGVRRNIWRIIPHKNFKAPITHDIALIELNGCLGYNNRTIQNVKLLPNKIGGGVNGTVSGWGYINQSGNQTTNDLKQLRVKTITNAQCKNRTKSKKFPDGDLCTLNVEGEGFCQGDSGGPLVEERTQALMGIVSANYPCARGLPDIYTRVSSYIDWIIENAK